MVIAVAVGGPRRNLNTGAMLRTGAVV